MGPNDPFATVQDVNPPTAIGAAPSAGQSSGALSQRVSVGALAGALVAMIGVLLGPGAAAWVVALGLLGAGIGAATHLATSATVRGWLVRLLDDRP